ncbi:unnamed protein product [Anisakis simplex]|uniref:DDE_Tnp_1_7 domain-containing protein n=1 Tax=Anisakis simplex TaxID=6269 RepID=A0A0M3IZS4_ANISI|nr:unnamed protein product [Anisakis simplex]
MLNAKLGCEMRTANATTDRSNDEDAQVDFESVESRSELNLVDNSSSSDDAEENDREMDIEDLVIRDEFNAYSTIESSQMKLQNLPQSTSSITTSKDHQTLQRSLSDNSLVSRHQTQQNQPSDSTLEPSIVSSSLITTSPIAYRHKSLSPSPNSKYEYKASICAQSIEIEYLLHNAVFFLARSSAQNIELAKQKSYWTTTKRIEQIYDETFCKNLLESIVPRTTGIVLEGIQWWW